MARARQSDPATSHEAAAQVEARGKAESDRIACFHVVANWPGCTAAEIAVRADLERHVPSRRLPELRKAGKVRNGDARLCSVTGNSSMTWLPMSRKMEQQGLFLI